MFVDKRGAQWRVPSEGKKGGSGLRRSRSGIQLYGEALAEAKVAYEAVRKRVSVREEKMNRLLTAARRAKDRYENVLAQVKRAESNTEKIRQEQAQLALEIGAAGGRRSSEEQEQYDRQRQLYEDLFFAESSDWRFVESVMPDIADLRGPPRHSRALADAATVYHMREPIRYAPLRLVIPGDRSLLVYSEAQLTFLHRDASRLHN